MAEKCNYSQHNLLLRQLYRNGYNLICIVTHVTLVLSTLHQNYNVALKYYVLKSRLKELNHIVPHSHVVKNIYIKAIS